LPTPEPSFASSGEVQASGKTASEIEKDLTRQLGAKYPQISPSDVSIKEHNSRVTIEAR